MRKANTMIIDQSEVPYLKQCPADGRIRPLLTYFEEGKWHSYVPTEDNKLLDFQPVSLVNGLYLARDSAATGDLEIPLLTFLFQYFPNARTFAAFQKLHDDLENALAVLHKQPILFKYFNDTPSDTNYGRVITTEIEYSLFNHRSAYDLLHGIATAFVAEHVPKAQKIPDSFRRLAEKTHEQRVGYGFSTPISQFYQDRAERFMLFRDLRDAIGHNGDDVRYIYRLPDGFGIGANTRIGRKLQAAGLWEVLQPTPTGIGSCFGFIALLCSDIFDAVDSFTTAFTASFQSLPGPTAEGYRVFSRSPLFEHRQNLQEYISRPWRHGPPVPG